MARTIEYTAKAGNEFFTVAALNALFAELKAVIDGKLDRRASTIIRDILLVNGGVINVPASTAPGDLLPREEDAA